MANVRRVVLLVGLFAAGAAFMGCEEEAPDPPSPPDIELQREIGLAPDERVHRIDLGGRGAEEHVVPTHVRILAGDLVQFVSLDERVHVVSFLADDLSTERGEFLRRTNQMSGPPLLQRGSRFLVHFLDAPPGPYPFVVRGNGRSVGGEIRVLR